MFYGYSAQMEHVEDCCIGKFILKAETDNIKLPQRLFDSRDVKAYLVISTLLQVCPGRKDPFSRAKELFII